MSQFYVKISKQQDQKLMFSYLLFKQLILSHLQRVLSLSFQNNMGEFMKSQQIFIKILKLIQENAKQLNTAYSLEILLFNQQFQIKNQRVTQTHWKQSEQKNMFQAQDNMEAYKGIEKYLKEIFENVEKAKIYILRQKQKFKQVETTCNQLLEMIPSQLRKYLCQTYSINTKKQDRKMIPQKIEAYVLISFIYQNNQDKIQKAIKKGQYCKTRLNEYKQQEKQGGQVNKINTKDINSNDQNHLNQQLELILFSIKSAEALDQTNKTDITEKNYQEFLIKRLEKLENLLEINLVLKMFLPDSTYIRYLGNKMINQQTIFILIDMKEKDKKIKGSIKDRQACFFSYRNELQQQIISPDLVSFDLVNRNNFTTSSVEQGITLFILMNIQHRITYDLFPQDQQYQNYNNIEQLVDSQFFDELLGEINENIKNNGILNQISQNIKNGEKQSIEWKECSYLEDLFLNGISFHIEHKLVHGISISTLKPNQFKRIQQFNCFITNNKTENGKPLFQLMFQKLEDEILWDQNNLSESLDRARLLSRSKLINKRPYIIMNESKEALKIKLNSYPSIENKPQSKIQFFCDIVIFSLVWLCQQQDAFFQFLETIVKHYQSKNLKNQHNQLFRLSNSKELLEELHKLKQFESFKSFESSKEYVDVFGNIGRFLIEILPQNKPADILEQAIIINQGRSQMLEQETQELIQIIQSIFRIPIDIMQPKNNIWYNNFLTKDFDIQVDIQWLPNESRANDYFMRICFQLTSDKSNVVEEEGAEHGNGQRQQLYISTGNNKKGQQSDLESRNETSSINNLPETTPQQKAADQNQQQQRCQQVNGNPVSIDQNLMQSNEEFKELPELLSEHSDLYYLVQDQYHVISLFYLMNMKHAIRFKENAEDNIGHQMQIKTLILSPIFRLIDEKVRQSGKIAFRLNNLYWNQEFCNFLIDSINDRNKLIQLKAQYILPSKNEQGNYDIVISQQYSVEVKPINNSTNYIMEFSYQSPKKGPQVQRDYCVECKLRIATVLIKKMCQFCFVKEIQNNY